jgi:hypothetical protein
VVPNCGRRLDAFELTVRFVCGVLAGLLLGLWLAVYCWPLAPLRLARTLIAYLDALLPSSADPFWRVRFSCFDNRLSSARTPRAPAPHSAAAAPFS